MGEAGLNESLHLLLRSLRLPSFAHSYEEIALRAVQENWSFCPDSSTTSVVL